MAWEGVITNAGNAMLQQWVDGKTLHIVSATAGTGRVPAVSLMAQTVLANQKQAASIISSQKIDAGRKIKLQLTAPDVGYNLTQYGVWARLDDGQQTLLALFQNNNDIPIPSKDDSPDFIYTFYALLAFSNNGKLELHIDTSALVAYGTMQDAINAHDKDPDAHAGIRKGLEALDEALMDHIIDENARFDDVDRKFKDMKELVGQVKETADEALKAVQDFAYVISGVPTQYGTVTYTGEKLTPQWNGYNSDALEISGETSGTNAGTYTVTFTPKGRYHWEDGSSEGRTAQWSIEKATPKVTAPTAISGLTYNSGPQNLVNPGFTTGGTLQYACVTRGSTDPDDSAYNAAIPAQTNAGAYDVYYRAAGDSNYNSVAASKLTVSIAKAAGTLTVAPPSVALNESSPSVNVTVTTNSDGKITATPKDTSVATATVSGKTVTVSAVETPGTPLGSKAVGDIVTLKVGEEPRDFIIVNQGSPNSSLYENADGTWLLMKDCYERRQWHSSNVNDYANSTIHSYLNRTILGLFEKNIQDAIKQVKIPHRPGSGTGTSINSGANGLSCKIFLLSGPEVHFTHRSMVAGEGATLDYFASCATTSADSKRIAYFNNLATTWWLRSPGTNVATESWRVEADGIRGDGGDFCTASHGVRPALVLPSDFIIDPPPYKAGETTVTISVGEGTNHTKPADAIVSVNANFLPPIGKNLDEYTWDEISQISEAGAGASYFEIGDTKKVRLEGTVGTLTLNTDLYVYILGFDHNAELEGKGITFGTFKTAASGGTEVALCDSSYLDTGSSAAFRMNTSNTNSGGWKNSYMKTTICPAFENVIPVELRSNLKTVTKYTDNRGVSSSAETNVTATEEKFFILSEYEVFGTTTYANTYEANKQAQYKYYSAGNDKKKYQHNKTGTAAYWWLRSPRRDTSTNFARVDDGGKTGYGSGCHYSLGFAPAFMV